MSAVPRGQTEDRKAYMKAWNSVNPQDRRAYKTAYDKANKEKIAKYREEAKERIKAQRAEHYQKNRERILAKVRADYQANKDRIAAYQAAYYAANLERVTERNKNWRDANPAVRAHHSNKRRVQKSQNGGSHTLAERLEKFEALGNVCFYCGKAKPLTIDHDIPLARGGTDDIDNILPACRSCNSRKKTRTAREFIAHLNASA
jgi:5-methylcytosine-specific restriction endonuclease McrA